jgi:hypothetical protein
LEHLVAAVWDSILKFERNVNEWNATQCYEILQNPGVFGNFCGFLLSKSFSYGHFAIFEEK